MFGDDDGEESEERSSQAGLVSWSLGTMIRSAGDLLTRLSYLISKTFGNLRRVCSGDIALVLRPQHGLV